MEWISVKDKMPETDEFHFVNCLVCRFSKSVFEARWNPRVNDWQQLSFEKLDNITHWMPLPEPPTA